MNKICAKFKVTTPMVLGGADETAELKLTSVKGALRYWFRAIKYGEYRDYKKVKKIEDELFGSTNSQSKFFLKLDSSEICIENEKCKTKRMFKSSLPYFGYGLDYEKEKDTYYRSYIVPRSSFTIKLYISPKYQDKIDMGDLTKPIMALGLFGGLGSRSRRGLGSVTLESISVDGKEQWTVPASREELAECIKVFYSSMELDKNIPEYTAFSKNTKTIVLQEFKDFKGALKHVESKMINFRKGYGKDSDIVSEYQTNSNVDKYPEKVVFGLPHNYTNKDVEINAVIGKEKIRRSSPLLIKIISVKDDNETKYIPLMTLFPSRFLPEGSKILLENEKRNSKDLVPGVFFSPDNKVINGFIKEFPERLEVKPFE